MCKKPKVSDHAVIRYLERRYNVDIEAIKDEMLTPQVCTAIRAGAEAISVNNIKFMVCNHTIVTTLKGKSRVNQKERKNAK